MNLSIEPHTPAQPRRPTTKSPKGPKITPVILVCIYSRGNTLITHDLLYQLFSVHGQILRILIFEKLNVLKAFVEFSTTQSASQAKRNLDEVTIFEDGSKMSIYFSNLKTIKFQNNNTGGKDYTIQQDNNKLCGDNKISMNNGRICQLMNKTEALKINSEEYIGTTQNIVKESEQKEDEIFSIVNNFNEKVILDEDEEEQESENTDLEKDDLSNFLTAFQSKTPNTEDFSHPQKYPAISDSRTILDNNKAFSYSPTQNLFCSSSNYSPLPPQNLTNDPSLLLEKVMPIFNKSSSLSRCSTLSEIPDHNKANRSPLTRMTSLEEVISQSRSLQRHKTFTDLNVSSQNGVKLLDFHFHHDQTGQQSLTKFPSSNNLELFKQGNFSSLANYTNNDYQNSNNVSRIKNSFTDENDFNLMNAHPLNLRKQSSLNIFENYDEKKSQVLYVKGLNHPDIKVYMLYNIFSNFGNLLRIIFIRTKAVALLEFENEEYSTVAKEYLNNIIFMSFPLRIYYSNYSAINLSNKRHSTEIEEVFRGTPKTFRFKKNGNVSINPPSATLHLSNLIKEACSETLIKQYFGQYARIESIRFLHIENTKNMCLLKLASIEESVNALAHLHDTNFHGRNIQISFSRSKF